MIPLFVLGVGVAALVGAALILRTFGPGYQLARLLATTPHMSVEDAVAIATSGRGTYVRLEGRIDSPDDFEDEHHRPLVFRRRRLEVRRGQTWDPIDVERTAVAFDVRDGLFAIGVDVDALDEGLVVLSREATGTAADVPDTIPTSAPADAPVRMRLDQVSSVEHAIVLGVPTLDASGRAIIGRGRGRPLVLTTLAQPEAMRVLAGGRRARPIAATTLLFVAVTGIGGGLAWALVGGVR